jgi:predicted oxidoreductase
MPARLSADVGGHVVIRPLVYVAESDCDAYARACGFPIVGCACRACNDAALQRQRIKRLVADLDRDYPGARSSMLRAVRNVVHSHLLDPRIGRSVSTVSFGSAVAGVGRGQGAMNPDSPDSSGVASREMDGSQSPCADQVLAQRGGIESCER